MPLVRKVEGPFTEEGKLVKEMIEGQEYIFKATEFQKSTLTPIKHIWWAEKIDDGKIVDLEYKKGENPYLDEKGVVCFKYKSRKGKKIRIYAYCSSPSEDVSIEIEQVLLPIYVARYSMPGLSGQRADDIANDMTFGKGTIKKNTLVTELVKAYVDDYTENGSDNVDKHSSAFAEASSIYSLAEGSEDILTISKDLNIREAEGLEVGETLNVELEEDKFLNKEKWTNEELFKEMLTLADSWVDEDKGMLAVFNAIVGKFKKNEGGIFTHPTLTDRVCKHASFGRYCAQIEEYIKRELENKTLKEFEDKKVYLKTDDDKKILRKNKGISLTPSMGTYDDRNNGLALCIHDFWAVEVIVTHFKITKKGFELTYKVILWDNFGLNAKDLEAGQNGFTARWYDGFDAWFVLQHFRGYRPFLTKVEIDRTLTHNY